MSFILYINLIIYILHKNKLEYRKLSLQYLRNFSKMNQLFYFSGFEINLSVIFCKKTSSNYFMNRFECCYSNHFLYFILSILYCVFEFFLTSSFNKLYYNKHESCCSSISKFIISNHTVIIYIIKIISITLFSYHKIHSIDGIICFYFFISSIILLYFITVEYKYQFGKNTKLKIHFALSNIYLFASLLLEIGYLIRKKNFNGLIYILCVLTLMDFIYFLTLNENEITIEVRNLSGQKEFQIYNQLNLLIYSLEKIKKDRKHLLNLVR